MKKDIFLSPLIFLAIGWSVGFFFPNDAFSAEEGNAMVLKIKKTNDFQVMGDGSTPEWKTAEWISMPHLRGPRQAGYDTDAKILYSETGMYFLFRCGDGKLTASLGADFLKLYTEDVVEVFLWPDERYTVYFEYELSPLNYELPIIIPNFEGNFMGWRPWRYEGERLTRHATAVKGGKKESGATISEWTAEIFIPYTLLRPLQNVPPKPGTRWRMNLYRCDYDTGEKADWSWQPIEKGFHEFQKFGTIAFE